MTPRSVTYETEMDPLAQISRYLAEVRRRLNIVHVVRDGGLFLAGIALLLLGLLLAAASVEYLALIRLVGLALAVVGCSGFALHIFLGLRRLAQETAVARFVGRQRPRLLSDLLSTVELGRDTNLGRARFSAALFEALAWQTWSDLTRRPPTSTVSPARLRPAAVLVAITAVLWAAAATSMAGTLRRGSAKLFALGDEQGQIAPEPTVGDIKLTYHYPTHMGRPERVVSSSTGHITAPRGTVIRLQTSALIPVIGAQLRVQWRGEPSRSGLPLAVSHGRALDGRLPVTGDGSYRFEFRTPERRVVIDPIKHRIDLEPDAPPRPTLYGPPSDIEVTSRHRLEIGYAVEDDYGVGQVSLAYQVGAQPAVRRQLWRGGSERRRNVVGTVDWDLALIDLPPGARIAYWIEALDNDMVSGPKSGRSEARFVRIYSAEEKHARILAQQQALLEQALRVLADRLLLFEKEPPEHTPALPENSPALRLEKTHSVHRANSILVDGLRELRNQMRQDPLVPKATLRSVSQMHQRLAGLIEAESALLKSAEVARRRHQVRPTHLTPLREHNPELVREMERDVLLLANLLDEQRLQSLMALATQLRDARKRLADLLQTYAKTRDEKLRQEILRQIERMERQVAELMAQISKLRRSLPDEYLNPEALKNLDLQGDLRQVSSLLRDNKLGQLESSLAALDRKLQQVQSMLEGNLQHFRDGRMASREKAYSALLDELGGMEAEQRQLVERTGQIISRYRKRASRLMKSTVNPFVRRELAKLEALRKRVTEIDPKTLSPYDQEQLDRVKQRVEDLKGMLDQGDLDEALQMARRTANGLQLLQDDLTDELEGPYAWKKGRAQRSLQRVRGARKIASEIASDLEAIFPSPKSLLDADDLRELRELQRKQQALRKRVLDTAAQLEGNARSPFVGPELPRGLREATELMGKAIGKLRQLQPQEAHGSEEAAAEQLSQLQKQMQQSRQPKEGIGAGTLREKIEIPGADSFHPPREFRQEIMDAMKEKAPPTYRQQVKRYYEEIVR
jgi:hypothetical protein